MGEAEVIYEDKVYETTFSFQNKQQKQPRNLLHRFSSDNLNNLMKQQTHVFNNPNNKMRFKPQLEVDLNLNLGGIYNSSVGNRNPKQNPLIRSSSIAAGSMVNKNCSDHHHQLEKWVPKSFLSLERTCSLPVEMESSRNNNNNKRVMNVNVKELRIMRRVEAKKRVIEKQRSIAEKEKLVLEGVEGTGDCKSFSKTIKTEPATSFETTSNGRSVKKVKLSNGCIQDGETGVIKKMPSVTTTGDGPNGRKIEGFLYKYMKGQVSIVCVCHGSFLSPEEFVKHAGGKDVTNPMRHINVSSTSFSY